jgi:hypothetical protein
LKRIKVWNLLISILLLSLLESIFATQALSIQGQPLNVQLTSKAWDAFYKHDYKQAMTYAERCIKKFLGSADREEAKLEKDDAPLPQEGPEDNFSDQEKKAIFSRGTLNDVATCFYIKGISAERLGQKDEAKKAYQAASKYTYARCYDPKGWFWSPSKAASDRLNKLK